MDSACDGHLPRGMDLAATRALVMYLAGIISSMELSRLSSLEHLLPFLEVFSFWSSLISAGLACFLILWAELAISLGLPGLPWSYSNRLRRLVRQSRPMIVGGATMLAIGFGLVHSCSSQQAGIERASATAQVQVTEQNPAPRQRPAPKLPTQGETLRRTSFEHMEHSIKLLTFNSESGESGGAHWRDVGLVWATAALFLLGFEAIVKLFSQPIRRQVLRFQRGHYVVCGLGQLGEAIVRSWNEERRQDSLGVPQALVVIESNPNNPNIPMVEEEFGGIVHIGDGTDLETLRLVSAHRAKALFAVMHDDDANVECVRALHRLADEPPPSGGEIAAVLHLIEGSMVGLQSKANNQVPPPTRDEPRLTVQAQPFNVLDQALNQLFTSELLEGRPEKEGTTADFIVIGFSSLAEEVVLRIGEQAHYENRRRSRVTVVHAPAEKNRVEAFRARYPGAFKSGNTSLKFHPPPEDDVWQAPLTFALNGVFFEFAGRADADKIVNEIVKIATPGGETPIWVFVCLDDQKRNVSLAVELKEELARALEGKEGAREVVLLPYVSIRPLLSEPSNEDLTRSLTPVPKKQPVRMKLWGDSRQAINVGLLESNPYLELAFTCHKTWSPGTEKSVFRAGPSWIIHSSLMSALHLHTKFAGLGWSLSVRSRDGKPSTQTATLPSFDPGNDEIIVAAEVEKNRWNAERLIAGWKWAVTKDVNGKKHNLLVPWTDLTDKERGSEREKLVALLGDVGKRLSEGGSTPGGGMGRGSTAKPQLSDVFKLVESPKDNDPKGPTSTPKLP